MLGETEGKGEGGSTGLQVPVQAPDPWFVPKDGTSPRGRGGSSHAIL